MLKTLVLNFPKQKLTIFSNNGICRMIVMISSILLIFYIVLYQIGSSSGDSSSLSSSLGYLQQESLSLTSIQQTLVNDLRSKYKISIGYDGSGVIRNLIEQQAQKNQLKVAMSKKGSEIDCRISLEKVPHGRKAIAPCKCLGSQQWIQYSTYNKLRRKDPSQWKVCRTCQAPYINVATSGAISSEVPITASILSYLLDKREVLRWLIAANLFIVSYLISLPKIILKFFVSKAVWQQYPQWSRITHLPLVLKLWFGRLGLGFLWQKYLTLETSFIQYLSEIETSLIEPNLIVNT